MDSKKRPSVLKIPMREKEVKICLRRHRREVGRENPSLSSFEPVTTDEDSTDSDVHYDLEENFLKIDLLEKETIPTKKKRGRKPLDPEVKKARQEQRLRGKSEHDHKTIPKTSQTNCRPRKETKTPSNRENQRSVVQRRRRIFDSIGYTIRHSEMVHGVASAHRSSRQTMQERWNNHLRPDIRRVFVVNERRVEVD